MSSTGCLVGRTIFSDEFIAKVEDINSRCICAVRPSILCTMLRFCGIIVLVFILVEIVVNVNLIRAEGGDKVLILIQKCAKNVC